MRGNREDFIWKLAQCCLATSAKTILEKSPDFQNNTRVRKHHAVRKLLNSNSLSSHVLCHESLLSQNQQIRKTRNLIIEFTQLLLEGLLFFYFVYNTKLIFLYISGCAWINSCNSNEQKHDVHFWEHDLYNIYQSTECSALNRKY